jgi:hypothetical protein
MRVEERDLIYDAAGRPARDRITFFPGLCPLSSGTILCGFYVGSGKHSPDGTIRVCRSRDAGRSWHELPAQFATVVGGIPGSLAGAEMVETEPGRLLLFTTWFDRSDPARPLFDPDTEGLLRSRQLYAGSRDEGETWSAWREVPTTGLTGCATTGPVMRWPDGTFAYAFESFKEFDDPSPARHAAWLVTSRDGGRFSQPLEVAQHPEHSVYYWDQRLCTSDGSGGLIAMFWTHDLAHKRDLNVHLREGAIRGGRLQLAPIRETTIPGQIAAPCLVSDGRLLAFVVDRGRPGTLKLWSSRDRGASWPESECLLIHTHDERALLSQGKANINFAQYWEDMGKWSFGHPVIRSLGGDRVLLAWYAGTPEAMSIHWARVDTGDVF